MQQASYVHGAHPLPLIGDTIGAHLDRVAARFPDRDALVVPHQDVRWTWQELRERAERLAAGLLGLGLQPGDRIGIWSQNRAEWVLTQFATAQAGLVMVNINPAYQRAELEYALAKVGCRALILAPGFKSSDYLGMLRDLVPELDGATAGDLHAARLPELRHVIRLGHETTPGMLNFDAVAQCAGPADVARLHEVARTLQFDDPVNIQFTSGTTGAPKGATLTHHNILNNGFFIGEAMRLTEHDRLVQRRTVRPHLGEHAHVVARAERAREEQQPHAGLHERVAQLRAVAADLGHHRPVVAGLERRRRDQHRDAGLLQHVGQLVGAVRRVDVDQDRAPTSCPTC